MTDCISDLMDDFVNNFIAKALGLTNEEIGMTMVQFFEVGIDRSSSCNRSNFQGNKFFHIFCPLDTYFYLHKN